MLRILIPTAAAMVLFGCSTGSKPKVDASQPAKQETLQVSITADRQLNRFEKNAHTLFLCLYQLKDPNGFSQLAQDKDGIPKLMECSRFDATVANARQFVVQPGQELSDAPARAEGTRFIGIAAGYYGLGKEKVTDLAPLMVGKSGDAAASLVRIELGPHQIKSMKVQ